MQVRVTAECNMRVDWEGVRAELPRMFARPIWVSISVADTHQWWKNDRLPDNNFTCKLSYQVERSSHNLDSSIKVERRQGAGISVTWRNLEVTFLFPDWTNSIECHNCIIQRTILTCFSTAGLKMLAKLKPEKGSFFLCQSAF